jgi:hypothetical protein
MHNIYYTTILDVIIQCELGFFNRNILIRFRISAHNLEIEKGRHQNIPLNERICKLCKLEIVDEITTILDVII